VDHIQADQKSLILDYIKKVANFYASEIKNNLKEYEATLAKVEEEVNNKKQFINKYH